MDKLDLYVSVMDKIDASVYYKMIDVYGKERVNQAMETGILKMKNDSGDFYQLQLKIWDKFGYYLATLNQNVFADDIKKRSYHRKKKSLYSNSLQEDDLFTLDEEIYYGFHLLKKDYIELFMNDGDYTVIDLYKVFSSIQSKETFDEVMERFGYFYLVCSRNSNFDIQFQHILREIREKYCDLKEYDRMGVLNLVSTSENQYCEELREDFLLEQVNMYIDYSIAVDKFLKSNMRLAEKFARKHDCKGDYDDLFQEAMIGIFNATLSYDVRNMTRFSTYAWRGMMNQVYRIFSSLGETIRVPEYIRYKMIKMSRLDWQFYQENGRHASMAEIAGMLGMREETLRRMIGDRSLVSCFSLDDVLYESEGWQDDITFLDNVADSTDDFQELMEEQNFKAFMDFMREKVTPREMEILLKHAGFGVERPMTYEEIGDTLGIKRQRVEQISKKAIYKLTRTKKGRSFNPFV